MLKRSARAAVLLLAVGVLAACGDDSEPTTASDSASQTESQAGGVSCEYVEGGEAAADVDLPEATASEDGTVEVTVQTSAGDLGLTLDAAAAPCTVNSFLSLAEQGFYDDTTCHRMTVLDGFEVLQCGDPTGTGAGGPGYSFADELTGKETYPAGTVAMANAGPDTNGSQFFLVYGDTQLSPDYTVFGTLDKAGQAAIEKVAQDGVDDANGQGDGAPNTPVEITGVTVD
ncbi:peptidylprolyl isomerase [Nocardioides insulae]|uniref:peptidylprolyl isomerase n=1 Tax=Nocardioides insulae TaxID=394734 RepID=UPI00041CA53B|nr:peptidylprolyl isomerase [Nocardioides insulae]